MVLMVSLFIPNFIQKLVVLSQTHMHFKDCDKSEMLPYIYYWRLLSFQHKTDAHRGNFISKTDNFQNYFSLSLYVLVGKSQ